MTEVELSSVALPTFCLCDGSRECGRKAVSDTIADASEPRRSVRCGVPRSRQSSGQSMNPGGSARGDTPGSGSPSQPTYDSDEKYVSLAAVLLRRLYLAV